MDKPIFFAVCRYIPDILRGESINVGVLTHIPETKWIKFHKTKNLSRVRHFDDEVELDVIRALLDSMDYQFNNNRTSELKGINSKGFLEKELVYFVNQIQFSEVRVLNSNNESIQQNINDLIDMYLYYDKKKTDRIDANRVRSLASKMITGSYLKDKIDRNPNIRNVFEQKPFDFSLEINGNKTLIKALSFDYKSTNRFFNELKGFMYDLSNLKDTIKPDIKVVINNTDRNENYEQIAYNLLKERVDVYTLEEFGKFIFEESSKENHQLELFN